MRGDSPEISHDWWCNLYILALSIYKYTNFSLIFYHYPDQIVSEAREFNSPSKKNGCIYSRQYNLLLRIVVAENSYKHPVSGWGVKLRNAECKALKQTHGTPPFIWQFLPFLPLCNLPITTTLLSAITFWWLSHLSLIIREEAIARLTLIFLHEKTMNLYDLWTS